MKRRDFIKHGTVGALSMGLTGCGAGSLKSIQLERRLAPFTTRPSGTMPMGEIGKTGIKVSRFGFGSHMVKDMVPYTKQREYMIREAYDLGVTIFDVYDREFEIYQYEPMGKYLAPVIDDVVISIAILPYDGRTLEQELQRDMKCFGRDYIDMVRIHAYTTDSEPWKYWDDLFRFKEKGYIRAVGIPVHDWENLELPLKEYPLDYVIFPYNFYHNIGWIDERPDNFDSLPAKLREKGVGVITMKPFAGDYLVAPFIDIARNFIQDPDLRFPQAALRYVINSGMDPDTTLTGMFNLSHVYENIAAYYQPQMSDEERELLSNVKNIAKISARAWLPDHYKWLENWAHTA